MQFDASLSRLEVNLTGQSTSTILTALASMQQCVQQCRDIHEVLKNPVQFFKQLQTVFRRFQLEDNVEGLIVLLDVIHDILPTLTSNSADKPVFIGMVLSEIIRCLAIPELQEITETLLQQIVNDEGAAEIGIIERLRTELDSAVLNSNDKTFLDAVRSVSSLLPNETSFSSNRRGGSGKFTSQQSAPPMPSTFSSNRMSFVGSSGNSAAIGNVNGGGGGGGGSGNSNGNNPRTHTQEDALYAPKVMRLSFIPHSLTEQWLLAHNADEVIKTLFIKKIIIF